MLSLLGEPFNTLTPCHYKCSYSCWYRCGKGGIGEALVTEFARRGVHAIATVLRQESSAHLSKPGITCFCLDVTEEKSVDDLHRSVEKLTGGYLHVLINCAYVQNQT